MAVATRAEMIESTVALAQRMGFAVETHQRIGSRVWGTPRVIDVVLGRPGGGRRFGIECRFDSGRGIEAERAMMLAADLIDWPLDGVIAVAGAGFDRYMGLLRTGGQVIQLDELTELLPLYMQDGATESGTRGRGRGRMRAR